MNAQTTILQKRSGISGLPFIMFLLMLVMAISPLQAQNTSSSNTITVKGMVSDEDGPLTGVNIALEGSKAGAITDMDGTFIFPTPLKAGDVLVFSYLGYKTQRIEIDENSTFINLKLTSEHIDIVGAPSVDVPYKSKRSR